MTYLELIEAVREAVTDNRYVAVNTLWSNSSYGGETFHMSIYDPKLRDESFKNPTAQGAFDAWQDAWGCFDVDEAVHDLELPKEATS